MVRILFSIRLLPLVVVLVEVPQLVEQTQTLEALVHLVAEEWRLVVEEMLLVVLQLHHYLKAMQAVTVKTLHQITVGVVAVAKVQSARSVQLRLAVLAVLGKQAQLAVRR
jgi:hypothetical protein